MERRQMMSEHFILPDARVRIDTFEGVYKSRDIDYFSEFGKGTKYAGETLKERAEREATYYEGLKKLEEIHRIAEELGGY
ncbi:MAG: hypothetical protein LBH28_08635 [Oscillospiraceae bacterium]|jgi:hypothetical protein|nr:hypothetical protein [Oscillospiraceae bacterium]